MKTQSFKKGVKKIVKISKADQLRWLKKPFPKNILWHWCPRLGDFIKGGSISLARLPPKECDGGEDVTKKCEYYINSSCTHPDKTPYW
ncbi:hypothetical protein KJA15_02170 [Patescibacteria group bacterium]|nr:hypothetical protein [Patescibacteria group bacterium]